MLECLIESEILYVLRFDFVECMSCCLKSLFFLQVTLQNVRPRLAIGEADTRKSLPITQAYCKLSALPEDVFKNAIEFVNK